MEAAAIAGRAPAEQREWEDRAGRWAALAALFAAFVPVIGGIYLNVALDGEVSTRAEEIVAMDRQGPDFLIAAGLQALGFLALIPVLLYLYRATRYRLPSAPSFTPVLAVIGPVLLAAAVVGGRIDQVGRAGDALPISDQGVDAFVDAQPAALEGLGLGGAMSLALALILVSLYAMRAGLVSRFMGVLGIVLGAVYILPLLATPLVSLFWLGGLALLFINRWPGGRGPAWEHAEALPWPSAAQVAAHRRAAEAEGEEKPAVDEMDPEPKMSATPGARSRKRRKKKRR